MWGILPSILLATPEGLGSVTAMPIPLWTPPSSSQLLVCHPGAFLSTLRGRLRGALRHVPQRMWGGSMARVTLSWWEVGVLLRHMVHTVPRDLVLHGPRVSCTAWQAEVSLGRRPVSFSVSPSLPHSEYPPIPNKVSSSASGNPGQDRDLCAFLFEVQFSKELIKQLLNEYEGC